MNQQKWFDAAHHKQSGLAPIAIILIIAGVLVLGGGVYYWQKNKISAPAQTACTQEAKICPDGSSVGRTGPNCEFAACLSPASTAGRKTITSFNAQLEYPTSFIYHDTSEGLQYSGSFLPTNRGGASYYAIEIPKSEFPNTNLVQSYLVFSGMEKINGEQECRQYNYQELINITKQIKIGNYSFYTHYHSGAAAGTGSFGDVYRIFSNGVCYEMNTWIFAEDISPDHGNTNLKEFDANKLNADFNQILSTFKFIEPVDSLNWKTYRNDKYGFEVEYPENWYLKDITSDPVDDTKIADNITMIDNNPILKNREASHLPSHGLIITIQNSFNSISLSCPPDKISSDTFIISDKSYSRCEMEFGIKSFNIPVEYNGKLYGFSYPAESAETNTINNILSTFKFIK